MFTTPPPPNPPPPKKKSATCTCIQMHSLINRGDALSCKVKPKVNITTYAYDHVLTCVRRW